MTENITFQEKSDEPTHKEPIEGIKVWLLLGCPSNILGHPSK